MLLKGGPVQPLRERGRSGIGWRPDQDEAYASAEARGWDVASQLEAMDREGLDLAVLFPTRGLFVLALDSTETIGCDGLEPEFAAAIARAYNDWLHDFAGRRRERLFGAGMVAPHDVTSAVAEVRRCVDELGFKAIYLAPGCVNRRPWHHPAYDPLWAEIERAGVPVGFHGGGRTSLLPDFSLGDIFGDRLMLWHTFNQPLGVMAAAVSLCGGGVLERFPRLKVALLEGNCSWAPWLMHRLDEHYEWTGWYEARDLSKKPSEYFRSELLGLGRGRRGDRRSTTSTGSATTTWSSRPTSRTAIRSTRTRWRASASCRFSEETQRKIVGDNWSRLYDIPLVRHRK